MNATLMILAGAIGQLGNGAGYVDSTSDTAIRAYIARVPHWELVRIEGPDTGLFQAYGGTSANPVHVPYRKGPRIRLTGIPMEGLRWRVTGRALPPPAGSPPGAAPMWETGTVLRLGTPLQVVPATTHDGLPTVAY